MLTEIILLNMLLQTYEEVLYEALQILMKLTMTVPTSSGEEKYMHMQQYIMVDYKHLCIAKQRPSSLMSSTTL